MLSLLVIVSMNWAMLWWEDLDEMLASCCVYEGIFGYTGSLQSFNRNDIAQVLAMNASWYMYSFTERALLAVFLLRDGRFVFVCEASTMGSLDSRVDIASKCIFASSLQMLLFFGIGDAQRRQLGIDISDSTSDSSVEFRKTLHMHSKKVEQTAFPATDVPQAPLEKFLVYPQHRLRKFMAAALDLPVEHCDSKGMMECPVFDGSRLEEQQCEVLWSPRSPDAQHNPVFNQWQQVWGNCSGYHCTGSWLNGLEPGEEPDYWDRSD
eukprot:TRINITY_DN5908_c0_g1_i2.p1 TRINITY_DN5908_c0_g1~~TRINITY_DN5908_c0_g1_i2.p1  ORF type:complete len:265 (-),score=44.29 TRINITY_DN5908_c0_g1_i2:177-971(-)